MAGSNNTLSLVGTLLRSRVNGGRHELPILQTLADLSDLVVRERTVAHGASVSIPFDGVTAKAVVVITSGPVTLKYNADAIGTQCGSFDIRLDTSITALTVVNSDPTNDFKVEVWIGS